MIPSCSGEAARDVPLHIAVEPRPGAWIMRMSGACTMEVADQVRTRLLNLADAQSPLVILDLADLEFIESTGLGGIVAGYLRLHRLKGDLRIVSPRPEVLRLLEVTRLVQLLKVYPDIETALRTAPKVD